MSLLNRGGRFACLRAIPVNIDVDVSTTLLRISYKAKGGGRGGRESDLLCANCKHLKSHATLGLQKASRRGKDERLFRVRT